MNQSPAPYPSSLKDSARHTHSVGAQARLSDIWDNGTGPDPILALEGDAFIEALSDRLVERSKPSLQGLKVQLLKAADALAAYKKSQAETQNYAVTAQADRQFTALYDAYEGARTAYIEALPK